MTRRLTATAIAFLLGAPLVSAPGCGARQQWQVQVATDAPVPAWGNRLLIEVLDDAGALACDGCRQDLAVTAASFPVSFGVVPSAARSDAPLRVRARLYRSTRVGSDGLPAGQDLIDTVGVLPALGGGADQVILGLWGLCFGKPSDLAAHTSCTNVPDVGPQVAPERELLDFDLDLVHLRPGEVNHIIAVECPSVIPDDMACLAPAAFLLGSADSVGVDSDYPSQPEIVRQPIWPVLIDLDEMTVGTVRQLVQSGAVSGSSTRIWRRGAPGVPAACNFPTVTADTSNDALPVNCISRDEASDVCAALSKEMVGEDTWELAAANGEAKTRYPWGEERPDCARAVLSADDSCVRDAPLAAGSAADVTTGGVRNLGGNLSEWVDGIFVPYSDPCWDQLIGGSDCAVDDRIIGWTGPWPHRGGAFDRRASSAASFARFASPDGGPSPSIGFRCAKTVYNLPP